jgi:hypothetical protein
MSRKPTNREDRFVYSVGECMKLLSSKLIDQEDIFAGIPADGWKLSSGRPSYYYTNRIDYTLTIQKRTTVGHIEVRYRDQDGTWQDPGPIYEAIPNLTVDIIESTIQEFYDPFVRRHVDGGRIKARVGTFGYQGSDTQFTVRMFVQYRNGCEVPFPVPFEFLTCKEKVTRLESTIAGLHDDHFRLADIAQQTLHAHEAVVNKNTQLVEKMKQNTNRMADKIRQLYAAQGGRDDCPVCYSVIEPELLVIRGCCHSICSTCDERCKNCPICRDVKV